MLPLGYSVQETHISYLLQMSLGNHFSLMNVVEEEAEVPSQAFLEVVGV